MKSLTPETTKEMRRLLSMEGLQRIHTFVSMFRCSKASRGAWTDQLLSWLDEYYTLYPEENATTNKIAFAYDLYAAVDIINEVQN